MSMKTKESGRQAPSRWRPDPECTECRTRRTQLLLAPSLHARIKAAADYVGKSLNAWCSDALERAVRDAEREREIDEALAGDKE